jgi:hypothetical protein
MVWKRVVTEMGMGTDIRGGDYPYSDTFRAYSSNTRIYGGAKGRFPLLLTTAKLRFYVDKFGRSPKVTL